MITQMNKADLLNAIRTERTRWESLVERAGEARMEQPGVEGVLSVKDLIAHTSWYELEMVKLIREREVAESHESDLWDVPTHERNKVIFVQNRQRPLSDVLAESRQAFQELVAEVQTLSDEDLVDPSHFQDMPTNWVPWRIIAENTYEHYQEHSASLSAWLDKASA